MEKNFFIFHKSKVTIILTTNPKYYFLKMSTSKDIAITGLSGAHGQGFNVNIFASRHFWKEKMCSLVL